VRTKKKKKLRKRRKRRDVDALQVEALITVL
jgi:hypothetical protein